MDIGRQIKSTRQDKGLSQEELARAIGATKSAVSRYEAGKREPSYDQLQAIATALGVPLADLLPEPTAEEKAGLLGIVQEIGLPHGNGTVAETKALLQRVAEMYGEKSVTLLRLTSIMSDAGVDKVIEYTKSIFQEYMDESVPKAGDPPAKGGRATPAPTEGKDPDAPETPPEGE